MFYKASRRGLSSWRGAGEAGFSDTGTLDATVPLEGDDDATCNTQEDGEPAGEAVRVNNSLFIIEMKEGLRGEFDLHEKVINSKE
jgi:hypothetical protein